MRSYRGKTKPRTSRKKKPTFVTKKFNDYDEISKYYVFDENGRAPGANLINDMLNQGNSTLDSIGKSIQDNLNNGSNPGKKIIPTMVKNITTNAANLANVDGKRKVFVTKYETGFPPTREVLDAAKEQGVQVKVVSDSKIDFKGNNSLLRNALTQGQGFNLIEYHVPSNQAQMTNRELRELIFNNDTLPRDENRETQSRSMVMNIKQQFLIKNQTTNLPLIFKIHIVKLLESPIIQADLGRTFFKSFYNEDPEYADGESLPGKIPIWYQEGPTLFENTDIPLNTSYQVSVSAKLKSLRKASLNFRKTFSIIETFSHTIKPGDFWNFSHTHNCGAGIDTEMLQQYNSPGTLKPDGMQYDTEYLPYTYGIIFETKGKLCEAQVIEAGNADDLAEYNPYIGTSPGQYFYEFKTSINFVRNPEVPTRPYTVTDITDDSASQSLASTSGLVEKEIRLPRADWREQYVPSIEANAGLYVIPFTSTAAETLGAVTGPLTDITEVP